MDKPTHDLTLRIGKMFGEAFKNDARKSVTMDEAIDTTDELISEHDRAILEAAADRHCVKTCKPEGYKDSDYHCRTCPDRRAILSR